MTRETCKHVLIQDCKQSTFMTDTQSNGHVLVTFASQYSIMATIWK